jgi:molecular chaperone GrpE
MADDNNKDFSSEIKGLGDDEIEIEFVDVDEPDALVEVDEPRTSEVAAEVLPPQEGREEQVDKLQAELDHVRDVYLRKLAEFDNFRKRVEREREEIRQLAVEDFIRELLPVLDNFERALQHATNGGDAFHQGVEMIAKQFWDTLVRRGVSEINPLGQPFNPELHEAVQRVENGDYPPGTVALVMLKGYCAGDRVIRPAMVGVAVGPDGGGGAGGGDS